MEKKCRASNMDLLRLFALLCVIGVHFFKGIGFYGFPVAGARMYIMVILRCFCMICVPLFLLLTGYLMGNRKFTMNHYLGIVKVLGIYVLASICCGVYRVAVLHEDISVWGMFAGMLSFDTAEYSWYIEMYLGLYLLIPLLNGGYDALPGKRAKQALIAVLLVLTALPGVVNIYCNAGLQWWLTPKISSNYLLILPEYWIGFYPVTLFMLGRYLKEYPVKTNLWLHLALIAAVALANGVFNIYRSRGTNFIWGGWQTWGALPNVIQAVLVFTFFACLKTDGVPCRIKRTLAWLSDCVLGAYLVSSIFDDLLYPVLLEAEPVMHLRLVWMPVMVLAVAVCSLAVSAVLVLVYRVTAGKLLQVLQRKSEK